MLKGLSKQKPGERLAVRAKHRNRVALWRRRVSRWIVCDAQGLQPLRSPLQIHQPEQIPRAASMCIRVGAALGRVGVQLGRLPESFDALTAAPTSRSSFALRSLSSGESFAGADLPRKEPSLGILDIKWTLAFGHIPTRNVYSIIAQRGPASDRRVVMAPWTKPQTRRVLQDAPDIDRTPLSFVSRM